METSVKHLDEVKHIKCNNKYIVDISRLDEWHKEFIDIIYKAIVMMEHNDNPEGEREVLYRITNYAINHFSEEETFMIESDYTEYKSHKKEHSVFSEKMIVYCNMANEGDNQIINEIPEYLKQWLVNHIEVTDIQFIDCLRRMTLDNFSQNEVHILSTPNRISPVIPLSPDVRSPFESLQV